MHIALIEDTHFLLEKAKILSHLTDELHTLGKALKANGLLYNLPTGTLDLPPKVSKGENYKGLPYLVLDYPRAFGKTDMLAFRVLFWWGHFVSASLYLSGTYLAHYKRKIADATTDGSLLISTNTSPWVHDLAEGHVSLTSFSAEERLRLAHELGYMKLSIQLPLCEISQLVSFGEASFQRYLTLLA